MDFSTLLKGKDCACGKHHSCDIKTVIIEKGAVAKLHEVVSGYSNILVVADKNTFAVGGEKVLSQLGDAVENTKVFVCDGFLVPNEDAIEEVDALITYKTDLIVGIGSGVIQDLCKYTSFKASIPYVIVATAPSMDGYASTGAAMIIGNMKITYSAHVPMAIIGDVDFLKVAPIELIKSGYGDILGKFSCLNDWKLSHLINGEYICDYVYDLTFEMLNKVKDLPEKLLARDEDAIKTLMEALVGVGVAMAYVGNSRPGSGSEHHLSHFFEITGLLENKEYFLHGIDVVYSAVYTERLREEIVKLDKPEPRKRILKAEYEEKIKSIYSSAADGVIALQNKLGWYDVDKFDIHCQKWEAIKNVLREPPSSDEMITYINRIGLDIKEFENHYGKEKLQNAVWFAKDLKDRYSVLWLYFDLMYKAV